MNKKRSKRYLESLKSFQQNLPAKEAFELLLGNGKENEKIKISFNLRFKDRKGKIFSFTKQKISLPFSSFLKQKTVIIQNEIKDEILKSLKENSNIKTDIEFLNAQELQNKVIKKNNKPNKQELKKIKKIIAVPASEPLLKPLERALSRSGLLPNKKNGYLTEEIAEVVNKTQNLVTLAVDKNGNLNTLIGTIGLGPEKLLSNYKEILSKIIIFKPNNLKGNFLKKVVVSASMGPGIKINLSIN